MSSVSVVVAPLGEPGWERRRRLLPCTHVRTYVLYCAVLFIVALSFRSVIDYFEPPDAR